MCQKHNVNAQNNNKTKNTFKLTWISHIPLFSAQGQSFLSLFRSVGKADYGIELIYNICEQEYQGGSGAGCSALVFSSYIYNKFKQGKYNKVLLMATGALLSSVSTQQGDSIPAIAHAVVIEK